MVSPTNRGRSPEVTDEELLNVIRRSDNTEVPTKDIVDDPSITIEYEAVRIRLNQLENENRVSSRSAGRMRMWELGELETDEPVREPAMAKAYWWSNLTRGLGRSFGAVAFGLLFAAVLFFIMFLHTQSGDINPILLTQQQLLVAGYGFAYTGALMGVFAGIVIAVAISIPKLTAWKITDSRSGENGS